MISALETLSVERRIIPDSTFDPLPGYRKVKDEIELVMSQSTNDAMEDLLDVPNIRINLSRVRKMISTTDWGWAADHDEKKQLKVLSGCPCGASLC